MKSLCCFVGAVVNINGGYWPKPGGSLGHVGDSGSTYDLLVFTAPTAFRAIFYNFLLLACHLLNNLRITAHHQFLLFQWLVIITLGVFFFSTL